MLIISGNRTTIRHSQEDRYYALVSNILLFVLLLLVLYPLVYIVSASLSSPRAVTTGRVILWPVDFSLLGYLTVFRYHPVLIGFRNTLIYTVAGTAINIALTLAAAYPLSRKSLPARRSITFFFTFTMFFSGGMIPNYLMMRDLQLLNTPWAMLLPGALSIYNMIVTRTFIIANIPDELLESAQIDGCRDTRFFFQMVLPLSKAVIAVITLFYAVNHWNAYFNAFIYLSKKELFPLQVFLREILVMNEVDTEMIMDSQMLEQMQGMHDLLKYALIVVASAPILCVYPFLKQYFMKGIMIGSVKG